MCVWHCAILDEEHVALRMGSSDDVLAWKRANMLAQDAFSK